MIKPRVLILTLYCGENEIKECIASLHSQTYQNFKHEIISGLDNREAHDKLYKRCMEKSNSYDYFLKFDADMVFSNIESLEYLINCAKNNLGADLISFTVFDFYTQAPIWGINLFSNRAKWSRIKDGLFVDEKPTFPGRKVKIVDWPNPHIFHSPNPSPYQAFVFGLHRALKVVQYDRKIPLIGHSFAHLKTIKSLYIHYNNNKDTRLQNALSGSFCIFKNSQKINFISNKNVYLNLFNNTKNDECLKYFKGFKVFYIFKWISVIGFYRFIYGVYIYFKKKLF